MPCPVEGCSGTAKNASLVTALKYVNAKPRRLLNSAASKPNSVVDVTSGYTGGSVQFPTYKQVCTGTTGHTEAVQVHFDPRVVSYEDLLEVKDQLLDMIESAFH